MPSIFITGAAGGLGRAVAEKFYVAGLTEALNLEWRADGLRVVDLWPLWAQTSLADNGSASVRRLGVRITPEQVPIRFTKQCIRAAGGLAEKFITGYLPWTRRCTSTVPWPRTDWPAC